MNKKEIAFKVIRIVGSVLAFFNCIMFFAMRPCWSGISATLGYKGQANMFLYNLPIGICVLLFIIFVSDIVIKKIFNKNWIHITYLSVSFVFFVAIIFIIILGAVDYMRFVWPTFFVCVGVGAALGIIYFLLFIYPDLPIKKSNYFRYSVLGICSAIAICLLVNVSINRITYKPVVYAVEDKYQIVFSTNVEATGWVEVGGENFYDTYAGTTKTHTRIHKVEVPMEKLDAAKAYTVHSQKSVYVGPFGGWLGRDVHQTVNFKPVDTSDGVQYLSFSDVHMNDRSTYKTASFVEKYDFVILAGDLISVVESFDDANFNNRVAYGITGGQIPVVYARGNHDVKGRFAEELHKFVGSNGEKFYFNFYFKDVYGIVLDIGEDHDDDWWEYYGTAHYDLYREEQIHFLEEEIAKKHYDDFKYHLAACHIPVPFVNYRHNHEQVKKDMTTLLNQMDIDMFVTGHQHQIMIFEPGLITPFTKLTYNPHYKS